MSPVPSIELLDLRRSAGVPVEQEASLDVRPGEAILDHCVGDAVGDVLAGVHVPLCPAPELGALGHVRAEDVAGRDRRDIEVGAQALGLRALAGARRAEKHETSHRKNPS
jgi:hypothetical protein